MPWSGSKCVAAYKNANYEGGMMIGKYHGKGVFTWIDGNKYIGDFNQGKGVGEYILIDGTSFTSTLDLS